MKTFLYFFTILLSFKTYSQSVSGYVQDEEKLPIGYAAVSLINSADSSLSGMTMTDSTGFYELPAKAGQYYINVSFIGFSKQNSPVFEVKAGENTTAPTLIMKTDVQELGGVTINYDKPVLQKTARGLSVNVESSPILQSGNSKEIFNKIPGVVMNSDGSITLKGKQNVVIYIDGKQTYMSPENLMQWLESMPATDIEKIEVFDTPPAKFDAAGAGGVINVVLKKGAALGLNGMVGLNAGYGRYYKFSPWGNFNYRQKKYNIYGSAWSYADKSFEIYESDYEIPTTTGGTTQFDSRSDPIYLVKGVGFRSGIDYDVTEKTTFGVLVSMYDGGIDYDQNSTTQLSGDNPNNFDRLVTTNNRKIFWSGQAYNLNLEKRFTEKESISLDLDFAQRQNGIDQSVDNERYDQNTAIDPSLVDMESSTNIDIYMAKVDYEKSFENNVSLEAGAKTSFVHTENDNTQLKGSDPNNLSYDSLTSNAFEYDENIIAAYAAVTKKWDKWTADIGLRMEQTLTKGYSPTIDSTTKRNYLNLFPNIAVKRILNEDWDASLSFTRRVNRPAYWQLNPYHVQISEFNYHYGNPQLQPEFSYNLNLGFSYKSAAFITLGYTNTQNAMTQVVIQDEQAQTLSETMVNLNNIYNYNLNLVLPIPVRKWWLFNFNGTVFYNQQISSFENGEINNNLWSYTLNMQQVFTLPKEYKAELNGYYNSGVFWNTLYVDPHYQLDFSVSKQFNRLNASFIFQDFLNLRESYGWLSQGDEVVNYYYKMGTQQVRISLSYQFGNAKIKGSRKRKTGSEDLQNRGSNN